MLEIHDEPNELVIYINGKPKIELIPQEIMESIVSVLLEEYENSKARCNCVCRIIYVIYYF